LNNNFLITLSPLYLFFSRILRCLPSFFFLCKENAEKSEVEKILQIHFPLIEMPSKLRERERL
jgi:hypothetical protein